MLACGCGLVSGLCSHLFWPLRQVEIVGANNTANIVQDLGDVCNRQVRPAFPEQDGVELNSVMLQAVLCRVPVTSPAQQTLCPRCRSSAQVYVIDTVLIPEDDVADIPQTIPAGALALAWPVRPCAVGPPLLGC